MTDRSFGTAKAPADPADFDSEPDNAIVLPSKELNKLLTIAKLSEERNELKEALWAKEKELSEAIYRLKPGSRK